MQFGSINFDESIWQALRDDKLVIFAGAGVSMGSPSDYPSFNDLVLQIGKTACREKKQTQSCDHFLGDLERAGINIHSVAASLLNLPTSKPNSLHTNLLRLFRSSANVRIVTTNFDMHFETAADQLWGKQPAIYVAPTLPSGTDFNGIIHIHGAITDPKCIVLSDADFGRAYLADSNTSRFLVNLFSTYTVLFVGYSHDDVIMGYLAQGLPKERTVGRFVLTGSIEEKWNSLGISPIYFTLREESDPFSELYIGIQRLGDRINRKTLDWKRRIQELSFCAPPTDEETISEIEQILQDETLTRLFIQNVNETSWLDWIYERKHLEPLFEMHELTKTQQMLANWVSNNFLQYSNIIIHIIICNSTRVNPYFWYALCRQIGNSGGSLDEITVRKLVLLLLDSVPVNSDDHYLFIIAQLCSQCKQYHLLSRVFLCMTECHVQYTAKMPYFIDKDNSPEVSLKVHAGEWVLAKTWEELSANIADDFHLLLSTLVQRLEEFDSVFRSWQQTPFSPDYFFYHRSAIEPHEQDNYREPEDIIINAIRDILDWLAQNIPIQFKTWVDLMITSSVPILRRIAIYAMGNNTNLQENDRISWLLCRIDIFDRLLHHEVYQFIKNCYSSLIDDTRKALVDMILEKQLPALSDESAEQRTDRLHYKWLAWLLSTMPTCKFAQDEFQLLKTKYPSWRLTDQPDLQFWHGEARWISPQSPLTAMELINLNLQEHFENLITFRGNIFDGPDREGLLLEIEKACTQNINWSISLAQILTKRKLWKCDIWPCIFNSWKTCERLDDWKAFSVFLSKIELQKEHAFCIANLFYSIVKADDKQFVMNILEEIDSLACSLWSTLEEIDWEQTNENWLQCAINHPAGVLVEYWLHSISYKNNTGDVRFLPSKYELLFKNILNENSIRGACGRCILSSQLHFLFSIDNDWTNNNLVPNFSHFDKSVFQQSWDGFLTWGKLYKSYAIYLTPAFIYASSKLNWLREDIRGRFAYYFATLLVFHIEDHFSEFLPAFYQNPSNEDRVALLDAIGSYIRDIDADARVRLWNGWLRQYWERRLIAVFGHLVKEEINEMLEWLLYLDDLYPDGVALATRFPIVPLEHATFLYRMEDCDLVDRYTVETANLLIHLAKCIQGFDISYLGDIANKLKGLPLELKQNLDEELVRLGLPQVP